MDTPILSDKNKYPTEEIIFSHIRKSRTMWELLFNHIHENHPDFIEQWKYYNDGKSWLMKVTRKDKTIFWLSIIPESFRITFYFGDKAETAIIESEISEKLKAQFKDGKKYGKIRGLTLIMNTKRNIEYAKELISIKLKVK